MKSYSHIISKLFYEPLLLTPMRHAALLQTLELRLGAQPTNVPDPTAPDPASPPDRDDEEVETEGSTVIIPVHGTLVMHPEDIAMSECGCAMEDLNEAIDEAENDPRIKRVIYDFRSPGGTVTGIPETGRKILHSRKETVGFFDSECCSGAAWLAEQCGRLYGTQSARFGSIGVYCMTLDLTKAMEQDGIKVNAIFAGKYKLLGASFKPLEDDERAILQTGVDKIYAQFKQAMESHRVVDDANFGNGLCFDGDEAAQLGFTDGVVESMNEILENMVD
jgi:signal peptide peptidase SppA